MIDESKFLLTQITVELVLAHQNFNFIKHIIFFHSESKNEMPKSSKMSLDNVKLTNLLNNGKKSNNICIPNVI